MSDPISEAESESAESLPESVVKAILGIKKAFGKYSDEEIYTLLKDCNMDPDETTQKLQYLETFQEVKRKERKVVSVVDYGRRRSRVDNRYSNYDGERHARQENGSETGPRFHHVKNASRARGAPNKDPKKEIKSKEEVKKAHKKESKEAPPPAAASSVAPTNGESTSQSETTSAKSNKTSKYRSVMPGKVNTGSNPGPGPTPASTPTTTAPSVPRQQPGKSSLGNSVGQLLSSPSDPVVEPSLIPPRNHGAIQRETTRNPKEDRFTFDFSGRQQSVKFLDQALAPEIFKSNILFGTMDSCFLEKSSDTEAPPKNESQPEPQSPPPPHAPQVVTSQENAELVFNQPKQEVLPPVSRSQQDSLLTPMSSEPPQQGENGTSLQTNILTPPTPRAQSSGATYPFIRNSYSSHMFPYYSTMYMPQVPQNVVHPVLSHGGYANQLMTGVAGAKYPYARPREENKEENMFYNLAQAYPPPAAAAQGGHGFPSVYHQSQSMSVPQSQQQMGGESAPLTSYPRYGGPYWNPNREN